MQKRVRAAVCAASALTLMVGVGLTGGATAGAQPATPGAGRFESVPATSVTSDNVMGLSNRPLSVMVETAGDAITVAQAKAGRKLTADQKRQLRADLKANQDSVSNRVTALGGKVGKSYQNAYNGLRVTIPAKSVAQLSQIPGVVGVHAFTPKTVDNTNGVPLVGAPQVWAGQDGVPGLAGEGIKVAIIDTGVDYTHADFGGPGTVAAYEAAHAAETAPADPALFGPAAARVKGGIDLVGDSYNADPGSDAYQPVPHPDSNPLDCNGHGTHVAGSSSGSGVLADGTTYTGGYGADTVSSHSWKVGPGVAPKSDIYAIRVFGCDGSTDVVVDALEWAVDNDIDVVNMSLGSPFGGADDPDAVATNNTTNAGVIVVASAGNSGPNPYITGSPGSATGAISVAASDPVASMPGATLALSTGVDLTAIVANGVSVAGLGTLPVKVVRDAQGGISLGCSVSDYTAAGVTGAIAVVKRGTCARVARAIYGQQAGAAAVLMVNNANSFPPIEGPITSNPDTGEEYTVTIPFLGIPSGQTATILAADGGTATLSDTSIANPGYLAAASFSSGGPRSGDSSLKPDVSAPGVSIVSAGVGTGNGPATLSGTSMAAPHTAGVAALVRQAHPSWGAVKYWKAAIVNTSDAGKVAAYRTRVSGAGLVQTPPAVKTQVVALGTSDTATLSFGYAELSSNYSKAQVVTLRNFGSAPATFAVGQAKAAGSPHSVTPAVSSVTVPAGGTAKLSITLAVPAATAGNSAAFRDVAGLVTFTPVDGANSGVALSVPYYLVPQATSNLKVSLNTKILAKKNTATANLSNSGGVVAGVADWYALGVTDGSEASNTYNDIKAVGVQSFPSDGIAAFAVGTYKRWSNAAPAEFDIFIDTTGDGDPEYAVVAADYGLVTAGSSDGRVGSFVFDLVNGGGTINFLADAPTNSTTLVLPVTFDQLGLTAASPRFTYWAYGYSRDGAVDAATTPGSFNAFTPSVSTGMYNVLAPNATGTETVTLDPAEFAQTPAKGLLVVSHDNKASDESLTFTF